LSSFKIEIMQLRLFQH